MIDLTPIYPLIPAKDKVIVPGLDYQMGTQLGGQVLASDARYWGEGESIGVMDEHGLYIGSSDYLTAPFYVSMAGDMIASSLTITGGTIRSGKTSFTDSANAGYYLGSEGLYVGSATDTTKLKYTLSTGAFDFIGTISSRATGIIASAISSTGHFIDDALNTSAKTILDSFTFGASGALQIGTYSAGVSGDLKISPTGILGRDKDNNTTFTIDATTGNATFAGTLSAPSGTLGTITSATITAGTFQTSATGARAEMASSTDAFLLYDTSDNELLKMYNAPSGDNTILRIAPASSVKAITMITDSSVEFTQDLIFGNVLNAASTGPTMRLVNEGLGNTAEFSVATNASRTKSTVYINAISGQGAHINLIPIATAPQTPAEGDFYTDTDHFPYYYDATAQRQIVLSGPTQTVNGIKTFGSFPVTPSAAPTADYEVANKKYVDDNSASVFVDGPGEATVVKEYWIFGIPFIAELWSKATCTIGSGTGSTQISPNSDSHNRILAAVFSVPGLLLGFGDGKKVIVEFGAQANNSIGNEDIGFGLSSDGVCFGIFDRDTADDACFTVDGGSSGKLYAHTANAGVGHTNTEITGITLENMNTYRIEFDPGVDVKFYINGTLEATNTTNLPDGLDIKFGAGSSGNTDQEGQTLITQPRFAIEK